MNETFNYVYNDRCPLAVKALLQVRHQSSRHKAKSLRSHMELPRAGSALVNYSVYIQQNVTSGNLTWCEHLIQSTAYIVLTFLFVAAQEKLHLAMQIPADCRSNEKHECSFRSCWD